MHTQGDYVQSWRRGGNGAAPDPAYSNLHTALHVTASELPTLRWNFNFLLRFVFCKECMLMAQDIPVSQLMGSALPDIRSAQQYTHSSGIGQSERKTKTDISFYLHPMF